VFGGWSKCDGRPQAAQITGLSRQFFNEWLPPVKPWTYMDSLSDLQPLLAYERPIFPHARGHPASLRCLWN
ncbi:hypothetical protein, partial [Allorhodopirellula heiligendammensis]|uniref:hypothetical protein n=1 Tax=Allorhodopirellula heiligendammensis TaxID=2714739 RepID=UPI00265D9A4E